MKRFWHTAAVAPDDEAGWQVLLDQRPVRLPGGGKLLLPTAALAEAVAAEWQAAGGAQGGEMSYAELPLTRLAGTAQDRIAANPDAVALELARYAESDLLCYRAAQPPELAAREAALWQPWLDWAEQRFAARLWVTEGVMHIAQPPQALAALAGAVAQHPPLALAALGVLVPALGSLVLGLAVAEHALDPIEAHALATLDEQFQEDIWGTDTEALARRRDVARDIADAARLLRLIEP